MPVFIYLVQCYLNSLGQERKARWSRKSCHCFSKRRNGFLSLKRIGNTMILVVRNTIKKRNKGWVCMKAKDKIKRHLTESIKAYQGMLDHCTEAIEKGG